MIEGNEVDDDFDEIFDHDEDQKWRFLNVFLCIVAIATQNC